MNGVNKKCSLGKDKQENIFTLATLYKSSPLLMVFLIILFLLYFIAMDPSSFSSYTYSSQCSVYYFSFYNVSPSCSASFLILNTEEKDKERGKPGSCSDSVGWRDPTREALFSIPFHHAVRNCAVGKIAVGDSTPHRQDLPFFLLITYLVEYVQCVGTEMKFTKVFLTHV